ncbi:MAG: hypothetical protein NZ700_04510 [Gemmataceae bacterium]|nr:hypothetical protein [Gemmataceae bacterium]MDW8266483.1 hypothetical protein [Gemmataceae bacterium]
MKQVDNAGVVAIHRWFADGEGWAYHPWFRERLDALLAAVKPELDRRSDLRMDDRADRVFVQEAMGGFLLGQMEHDRNCSDPKARGRAPTILRVVFLSNKPNEDEIQAIVPHLMGLSTDRVGPDEALKITIRQRVAIGQPIARPERVEHRVTNRHRWYLVVAGMIVVIASVALAWQAIGSGPSQNDEELRQAAQKMAKLAEKWSLNLSQKKPVENNESTPSPSWRFWHKFIAFCEDDGNDNIKAAHRFLKSLSQEQVGAALQGHHPDVHFLTRLPEKAAFPRNKDEVQRALKDLVAKLGRKNSGSESIAKLLGEIEEEMDYLSWWQRDGKRCIYALSTRPDAKISEYARKFVQIRDVDRANDVWQRSTAEAMLRHLRKWRVEAVAEEDVKIRPWLIYHCYFQLLSQAHFGPNDLREESWQAEFVKRLPETPLTEDGIFRNEEEMIQSLRSLAERLGAEPSSAVLTLLTNISSEMNFPMWKSQLIKRIRKHEGKNKRLLDFVERFRTG